MANVDVLGGIIVAGEDPKMGTLHRGLGSTMAPNEAMGQVFFVKQGCIRYSNIFYGILKLKGTVNYADEDLPSTRSFQQVC